MSPPKYGKGVIGTVTNGDKLLCNKAELMIVSKHKV